jgi:hypothetical protein
MLLVGGRTQKPTQPIAHMSEYVVGFTLSASISGLIQRKGTIGPADVVRVAAAGIAAIILPMLNSAILAVPFTLTNIFSCQSQNEFRKESPEDVKYEVLRA